MVSDKPTTREDALTSPPESRKQWEAPTVQVLGDLAQLTGGFGEGKIRGATDWVNTAGSSVYGARVG